MVTRRLNTVTSRTRGGTKHTAANDKAKTISTTKKQTKPNYAQIAKDAHKNLQQVKLPKLKKTEQKMLNYKLKQLMKLPKKEFVEHMKTIFTEEDARLLHELYLMEIENPPSWKNKQRSKIRKLSGDDLYKEIYNCAHSLDGLDTFTLFTQKMLMITVLMIGFDIFKLNSIGIKEYQFWKETMLQATFNRVNFHISIMHMLASVLIASKVPYYKINLLKKFKSHFANPKQLKDVMKTISDKNRVRGNPKKTISDKNKHH